MNRVMTVSLGVVLAACTGAALAQQRPGYERNEGRSEARSERAGERGEARARRDDDKRDQGARGQSARGESSRNQAYAGAPQAPRGYERGERGYADQRQGNAVRSTAPLARVDQRQAYNAPRQGLPSYGGNAVQSQGYERADYDKHRGRDRDDRWDRNRDHRRDHDRSRDHRWDRDHDRRWDRSYDRRWDRSYSDRRDHRSWRDHSWRLSWSHGWSGHRYRAPSRFYHPRGYSSRAWRIGLSVPLVYLASSYFVDYRPYGLAPPPYGCSWIRMDGDVLLVDNLTGEIVDVLYGFYY